MSSSSDIEKLFDHFGGDANAYQEIGRENEARSARTRWPLLVTLDLTQPTIPAIGQGRELARKAPAQDAAPAVVRQDATPKDATSVTRAKAPLFTRSHRRDIPPVVVATQPAAPPAVSRFGTLETNDNAAVGIDAVPAVTSHVAPATPAAVAAAPVSAPASTWVQAPAPVPALAPTWTQTPAPAPAPAPAPTWAQAPAPTPAQTLPQAPAPAWPQAPAQVHAPAWPQAPAHTYTTATAPAVPKPPASILGKLFAPEPAPAPPQSAAPPGESAPLQSVFDRLRGTPAQTAAAPAGAPRAAAPAASNSWLINGPRRS